jgi:peptidoglycan/xylan/chitin deacetylase (PgdA/CDA1 family)
MLAVVAIAIPLAVAGIWTVSLLRPASAHRTAVAPTPAQPTQSATAKPKLVAHPQPVPILVYHHVVPGHQGPRLLYVTPSQFAHQLAYLKSHNYQPVTLREVYDAWFGRGSLPEHPVVISFDDGYVDQVRNAAPLLRRYHWPAELALILDTLYQESPAPPTRLTPSMVRSLLADHWGLESHTVSHQDLTRLSAPSLRHELRYSRDRLQQIFGVAVDFVCYPGGSYNTRVERAARRAGYLAATSTDFAAATPARMYALPRIYCYRGESTSVFGRRLRAILAAAQRSTK